MCGIIGIINQKNTSYYVFDGLRTLQHRGEESCGMMTFDVSDGRYHEYKNAGTVGSVFNDDILRYLKGSVGIGHTRYPTSGKLDETEIIRNAQPYYVEIPCLISIVHNGQFTNQIKIKNILERRGIYIKTSGDLEPFLKLFALELSKYLYEGKLKDRDIIKAIKSARDIAEGGYSIVMLVAKGKNIKLIAFTSRKKIRPLVYGKKNTSWCFASESAVLDVLEYQYVGDVNSDEVMIVNSNGKLKRVKIDGDGKSLCMFEWTYFSRPDSVIDGVSVYNVRVKLGEMLAKKDEINKNDIDIVTAVPKSGYKYAEGYGLEKGIHPSEVLYKNEYIGRMFIRPPDKRQKVKRVKINPITEQIKGKNVVLIDDSIVRGETMKRNVDLLRDAGAKTVHIRIGTPKFIAPCFYGIDMTTPQQFIARKKNENEIKEYLGADTLVYTSIPELVSAIGKPESDICLGCLTGKYPTDVSHLTKKKSCRQRPYEV